MISLTSQLESNKLSEDNLQEKNTELCATKTKLQQYEEKLKSSTDELTKLQSEKKMLLKHDQVCIFGCIYSPVSRMVSQSQQKYYT